MPVRNRCAPPSQSSRGDRQRAEDAREALRRRTLHDPDPDSRSPTYVGRGWGMGDRESLIVRNSVCGFRGRSVSCRGFAPSQPRLPKRGKDLKRTPLLIQDPSRLNKQGSRKGFNRHGPRPQPFLTRLARRTAEAGHARRRSPRADPGRCSVVHAPRRPPRRPCSAARARCRASAWLTIGFG